VQVSRHLPDAVYTAAAMVGKTSPVDTAAQLLQHQNLKYSSGESASPVDTTAQPVWQHQNLKYSSGEFFWKD
jgi:hypothetical protein